jgi:hypothetical protein
MTFKVSAHPGLLSSNTQVPGPLIFSLEIGIAAMAIDVSDSNVNAKFDNLVERGIINYGPSKRRPLTDKNFPVSGSIASSAPRMSITLFSSNFASARAGTRSR